MNNNNFGFRVWNKKEKTYSHEDEFILTSSGELRICDRVNIAPVRINNIENFVVESCTGIKDKNGTLIFEGDYLQWEDGTVIGVMYYALGTGVCEAEIVGNIHEGIKK